MEAPVWKRSTSTNAPAPRTGVAPTASTKLRQVSEPKWIPETQTEICHCTRSQCILLFEVKCEQRPFNFPMFCMQLRLSGALWTTRHSAGGHAVPKWTEPDTAAAMQAFTWVAPLTTVSVRVSCNYVFLNWCLQGDSAASPHREAQVSYRAVPLSCVRPAQRHLSWADVMGTLVLERSPYTWIFYSIRDSYGYNCLEICTVSLWQTK